jgi:hypothetical protein
MNINQAPSHIAAKQDERKRATARRPPKNKEHKLHRAPNPFARRLAFFKFRYQLS